MVTPSFGHGFNSRHLHQNTATHLGWFCVLGGDEESKLLCFRRELKDGVMWAGEQASRGREKFLKEIYSWPIPSSPHKNTFLNNIKARSFRARFYIVLISLSKDFFERTLVTFCFHFALSQLFFEFNHAQFASNHDFVESFYLGKIYILFIFVAIFGSAIL